jgi:hypothetical protein
LNPTAIPGSILFGGNMAQKTINEMVQEFAENSSITDEDISDTYIPMAVQQFNDYINDIKTVEVTDADNATTGSLSDDLIIALIAASDIDMLLCRIRIDPETGQAPNRNQQLAEKLLLNTYGYLEGSRLRFPSQMLLIRASDGCSTTKSDIEATVTETTEE